MVKISKVVVCGMKGVGKTAILEQVIYGHINEKTYLFTGHPVYSVSRDIHYSAFKELHPTIEDIYVANIESDKGTKEKVRFYDTAGIEFSQITTSSGMTNQQLPRHYLIMADGYILAYDSAKAGSLDVLMSIKKDIDKNKDKKEVTIVVISNTFTDGETDPEMESNISKAVQWCTREKMKHFTVSALKRSTLYEPFIFLTSKLTPPPSKSGFTPLSMGRKVMRDSN